MVLSDREIWMEIGTGRLRFTPAIVSGQIASSAVDLRLGNQFTTFRPPVPGVRTEIDVAEMENPEDVIARYGDTQILGPNEYFLLEPGQFVLTYTLEYVGMPNYLAARVEGRSSLARLGISVHQTAPTVHATFEGQLRLEISHDGPYPCRLRPGQRICQLVIERLGSPALTALDSSFQGQHQDLS
jgi:dCTP deaminase